MITETPEGGARGRPVSELQIAMGRFQEVVTTRHPATARQEGRTPALANATCHSPSSSLSPLHPHPPTLPAPPATTPLLKQRSGFLTSTDEGQTSGPHGQLSLHPDHVPSPPWTPLSCQPPVLISRPAGCSPRQNSRTARAQPRSLSLAPALVHPGSGHGVRRPRVWAGL